MVERRVLPRPSGSVVYALTDYGRGLEDAVLIRLAGWGTRTAGEPREGDAVTSARSRSGCAAPSGRAARRPEGDLRAEVRRHRRPPARRRRRARGPRRPGRRPDLRIATDALPALLRGDLSPAEAKRDGAFRLTEDTPPVGAVHGHLPARLRRLTQVVALRGSRRVEILDPVERNGPFGDLNVLEHRHWDRCDRGAQRDDRRRFIRSREGRKRARALAFSRASTVPVVVMVWWPTRASCRGHSETAATCLTAAPAVTLSPLRTTSTVARLRSRPPRPRTRSVSSMSRTRGGRF